MTILVQILILFASLLVLAKSAEIIIKSLKKIANILSWSTFIVAFLILGVATSTPELLVGINAALDKTPQLSLGNIMGATIVLLTLVTGLSATISGRLTVDSWFTKEDLIITKIVLLSPVILLFDGLLSRFDALLIIMIFGLYFYHIYHDRQRIRPHESSEAENEKASKSFFLFIAGLIGLALASKFAVDSAVAIGTYLSIPLLLLGILIFSIGTNFPEIIVAFTALRKRQKNMVAGNILGSTATNSLVIALVALIYPIQIIDMQLFYLSAAFFTLAVLVFSHFIGSKNDITRREGLILLSIYAFFVISEIVVKLINGSTG